MSDNSEEDILNEPFESELSTCAMGNLQHSINRSLEIAANSKRTYLPGETKSTNHLIYEMNEFYVGMAQRINELNLKSYDNCVDDDEDVEDTDSVLYEVVSIIRKKRNDPEMKKQIEAILNLDQLMEGSINKLKKERIERQRIQNELCDFIDKEDDKYSKTWFFRTLCDLEMEDEKSCSAKASGTTLVPHVPRESELEKHSEHETQLQPNISKASGTTLVPRVPCEPKVEKDSGHETQLQPKKQVKFIKRNIQLAKNTPTVYNPAYSLTDEEKAKLDNLLIDLDKMEESDSVLFGNEDNCDHLLDWNDSTTNYPYSLSEQDQTRMREVESKLENLSEVSMLASSKERTNAYNILAGKPWQNEDRLKRIDEKLEKLQSERESFSFTPTEVVLHQEVGERDEDDTANDVESISYDTLCEQSQIMLDRIASIVQKANANATEYSDHEHDEPERD